MSYLFDRKGVILVERKKYPAEDELMEVALNAEADDFQPSDDYYEITCDPAKFLTVQAALEKAGIETAEAEVKSVPRTSVDLDVETGRKVMRLIETLDDNEDVQTVTTNANITEQMVA